MKKAISMTEQEIDWHERHRSEAPTAVYADAFIKGMRHLLDLFKQADASHKAAKEWSNNAQH